MIPDLIYDVGMHNGDDTAYYLHKGYRVVAVEADPDLVAQARERFACEIAADRMTIVHAAVGPAPGRCQFWINDLHREWSSLDQSVAARDGESARAIEVPCRRFEDLVAQFGVPYYLKIDIEGADRHCLDALRSDDLPKYVSFEATHLELIAAARELGYVRFKCISQRTFRRLTADHPYLAFSADPDSTGEPDPPEGRLRDGDWEFPWGASGPFGEQTGGDWSDIVQVTYEWANFVVNVSRRLRLRHVEWFDIHATVG